MSLELKKRGNTWTYVVDIGRNPITGKRKRKSKGGFKTKGECRTAASLILTELEKGTYFQIEKIIFEDYMKKYLESVKPQIKEKTYKLYEYVTRVHLLPTFGKMELSKIKPLHIQDFYNKSLESLSGVTVRHFHNVLNMAFNQAIKWQIINFNPCNSVEKPKIKKRQLTVWNSEQLIAFLNKVKNMTIYLPVLLATSTGMREGEICGLKWNCVDLNNKIIYIENQLQMINKKLELVNLKTFGSNRNITISDSIVNILKNIRVNQKENKDYFKENYNTNDFVVCKEDGSPYNPEYISSNFRRVLYEYKHDIKINGEIKKLNLCDELQIPLIRFHDLRHTHATLLLKANTNPKVVAERLGHSTVKMTLDTYSHVLPSMQKEAADKLNDIFSK